MSYTTQQGKKYYDDDEQSWDLSRQSPCGHVKFIPAVKIFQENNAYKYKFYTHEVWFDSETVEILHIQLNFNFKQPKFLILIVS